MTATAAEALELALWLHRVPARRAALLGRPLPDGVGQLLRVAGGAPDQVAAAAKITGEDEATILEAVRFYLQQILFHDQADAYRVLGLRPDAPQAKAREHHRLLQQWLHPDRHGDDAWETVYATRINRAWSHLKTPQSRAAYDATLTTQAPDPRGSRQGGEYKIATPVPVAQPHHRSRNLTYLVLLGCIGLLVLIALQQETPPQWQDLRPSLTAAEPMRGSEQSEVPPIIATLGIALADAAESAPALPTRQRVVEPSPVIAVTTVAIPPTYPHPTLTPREPPEPEPAAISAEPRVVPLQVAALSMDAVAPVIAVPVAQPPPRPAVPLAIPNPLDRMAEARARARLVSDYLGDPTAAAPPVWNDVSTFHKAQQLRAELHRRLGLPGQVLVEWLEPKWRLSADGAWLETGYRAESEQGRLDVAFAWREDQLLVRSIDLVPGT